jgi:hypothetical protein
MKTNPRLVLLATLLAVPLSQAPALGLHPILFLVGPELIGAAADAVRLDRVNRASFDKTVPFVLSTVDSSMVEEFRQAWIRARAGTASSESVVLILRMMNRGYSARSMGYSNEYKSFTFPWHPATIAIVHTHPNESNARPLGPDIDIADKYGVPIFTITSRGMYVYDPTTKHISRVKDGLDWLDPSKWSGKLEAKR